MSRQTDTPAGAAAGQTDMELVDRARQGDRSAFRTLVERYQRRVYSVALGMVKNQDDAQDVIQEAFLKAYRHLPNFKGISSFYTWLYRITVNLCLDHLRKRRGGTVEFDERVAREESVKGEELLPTPAAGNPLAEVSRKELAEQISRALDSLSEDHRSILILREVEGFSYEELAEILEINKGTVMSRLFHARRNLRKVLIDYLDKGESIEAAG